MQLLFHRKSMELASLVSTRWKCYNAFLRRSKKFTQSEAYGLVSFIFIKALQANLLIMSPLGGCC
jgi:hypothetical protein